MRKILLGLILLTSFILVSCTEITDEYENEQKPSIELKTKGDLVQIYEENEKLEDVTFTVVFKQFTENEILLENVTINWYVRDLLIEDYINQVEIVQVVKSPGEIPIRVEVLFTFEEKQVKLEADSLINVVKTPTNILVTNDFDVESHRISVTLGESLVKFTGKITGNLNHSTIKWLIQKQTTGEPVVVDEILVDGLEIVNNIGNAILEYEFTEIGAYIVTLQTGDGVSQDANRYISNSTHVIVGAGEIIISTENKRVLSESEGFTNRVISVEHINSELSGEGVYTWYLNGAKIEHTGLEFTHENTDIGGYLYEVIFVPNNEENVLLQSEPILIINGVEVATEIEMLAALELQTKAIILTEDIEYTNEADRLELNYPVTIYGNGHTLSSLEIEVFIAITSDNVNISNITISEARRYNLLYTSVNNGYLEDIKFDQIGGSGDASALASGEFGSAIYVSKSEVTINNIEFITGGLLGVRIESDTSLTSKKAKLTLLGDFIYSETDPLLLPIGSAASISEGVEVVAKGFDYFTLPAGGITIKRWDNQGDPISWEIFNPDKLEYTAGDALDLFGIGISIDIGFLGIDFTTGDGLMFVKLYIQMFGEYGKLELTNMDDELQQTYYIIGEGGETTYGKDDLVYSLTTELNINNQIKPELPTEPGQYKIKIYIGEEFYLGHITVTVTEAVTE